MFKENDNDITCTVCNTMDIGTVIQESDTVTRMVLSGENIDELRQTLTTLAREIESDPCEITIGRQESGRQESGRQESGILEGGELDMVFNFSCAAEKLIFEMRTRPFMS